VSGELYPFIFSIALEHRATAMPIGSETRKLVVTLCVPTLSRTECGSYVKHGVDEFGTSKAEDIRTSVFRFSIGGEGKS
jgi:hypothetical protein